MKDDNHQRHEHNEHNEHRQDRLTPPHGEPRPTSTGVLTSDPWVPGLVEVKFASSEDSGVLVPDLDDVDERRKPARQWPAELTKVINTNRLLGWKPSFPLTYPWSKQTKDQAEKFYRDSGRDKYVTFRFSDNADVSKIAADLAKLPKIERAKPVAGLIPSAVTDPFIGASDQLAGGLETQWYAHRCKLITTLDQFKGNGVIIAAIDWGFDISHPDYADGIKLTFNTHYKNGHVGNGNYIHHGTSVLALAGARDDGEGMVGFAPQSDLWAIQAGEDEIMSTNDWVAAIDFVTFEPSPHRKVIILEAQTAGRGNIESVETINKAIVDAIAAGVVVCVPAGNAIGKDAGEDDQDPAQPIHETGSILVGATWYDAQKNVVCSRHGERIAVYAPGDPSHDLTGTSLPGLYTNFFGGSSGAVAKVGGAVALMLEADNSLTPAQVKDLLRQSETEVVRITPTGEEEKAGVLLDCEYSISNYRCDSPQEQESVLTKSSAML